MNTPPPDSAFDLRTRLAFLLAKCACIMRKTIVNPRRFSHRKALINKEKPAITRLNSRKELFVLRLGQRTV